jgi:hypothetical protein
MLADLPWIQPNGRSWAAATGGVKGAADLAPLRGWATAPSGT